MAHVAAHEQLRSATIDTYSSAVSTWHRQATLSEGSTLGESTAVSLVRAGIHRTLRPAEEEDRRTNPTRADPLNRDVLNAIVAVAPGTGPAACAVIAAAWTGVEGWLRPNELLGPHTNRKEALQLEQVVFYDDEKRLRVRPVLRTNGAPGPIPHHFDIHLGATKADPTAKRTAPRAISYPPAVAALWNWLHLRASLNPPIHDRSIFLLQLPDRWKPLSTSGMMSRLSAWASAGKLSHTNFKGKSMRQGSAAFALLHGASVPQMQAAGGWSTPSMPLHYAGEAAQRARLLELNKGNSAAAAARR